MRQPHPRRKVPASARTERFESSGTLGKPHVILTLKTRTPIVGDAISYETWAGDKIHPDDARKALDAGRTLYYTTWED